MTDYVRWHANEWNEWVGFTGQHERRHQMVFIAARGEDSWLLLHYFEPGFGGDCEVRCGDDVEDCKRHANSIAKCCQYPPVQ